MNLNKIILISSAFSISGCANNQSLPLLFSQTQIVGIGASTNNGLDGVSFSLGYRDNNVAIIPVTVQQSSGDSTLIKSTVGDAQDVMSVLGQFEVSSNVDGTNIGLGKFFATGVAAQQLATGIKNKVQTKTSGE